MPCGSGKLYKYVCLFHALTWLVADFVSRAMKLLAASKKLKG